MFQNSCCHMKVQTLSLAARTLEEQAPSFILRKSQPNTPSHFVNFKLVLQELELGQTLPALHEPHAARACNPLWGPETLEKYCAVAASNGRKALCYLSLSENIQK